MKKILLIAIVGAVCTFSNQIFAQDKLYEYYLKKNNLSVADTNLMLADSIDLLNGCKIKFSANDSLVYADLITKDTVVSISEANLDNFPRRWIGGLYADFDNCFFWGTNVNDGIYGDIIYKTYPYFRVYKSTGDCFYYIDKNIKKSILILIDACLNPEEDSDKTIISVFHTKTSTFTSYILKEEIPFLSFKYIRYVNIVGDSIILKDIDNDKLYYGTLKKDNHTK